VFEHELFICAAHFIGDGMALHQFANDFFGLLDGASEPRRKPRDGAESIPTCGWTY
jgi:hypothetical protein